MSHSAGPGVFIFKHRNQFLYKLSMLKSCIMWLWVSYGHSKIEFLKLLEWHFWVQYLETIVVSSLLIDLLRTWLLVPIFAVLEIQVYWFTQEWSDKPVEWLPSMTRNCFYKMIHWFISLEWVRLHLGLVIRTGHQHRIAFSQKGGPVSTPNNWVKSS